MSDNRIREALAILARGTTDDEDLDTCIRLLEGVVHDGELYEWRVHNLALHNLARAYLERAEQSQSPVAAAQSIETWKAVLSRTSEDSSEVLRRWSQLALAMSVHGIMTDDEAEVGLAVEIARSSFDAALRHARTATNGAHHIEEYLHPLLRCLSASAATNDSTTAMAETVQVVSRALGVDPVLAVPLEAPLALLLAFPRVERDWPTTEAAMALGEEVLTWSQGRASTAEMRVPFAVAEVYRLGFDVTHDLADLDRAERLFDMLLSRCNPGEHWFHVAQAHKADCIFRAIQRETRVNELDVAGWLSLDAALLASTLPQLSLHFFALERLAFYFLHRGMRLRDIGALEQSIAILEHVATRTSDGTHVVNLMNARLMAFVYGSQEVSRDEIAASIDQAGALREELGRLDAALVAAAGFYLAQRSPDASSDDVTALARDAFALALPADPHLALTLAESWLNSSLATRAWDTGQEAATMGVAAQTRLVERQTTAAMRIQSVLDRGLVGQAGALCAARGGDLQRAIELLEEVRSGGVLGLGGNDRMAVRRLEQAGHPGLATELDASSRALQQVQWWDLDFIINDAESHHVLQKWNAMISSKRATHDAVLEKAAAALDQDRIWEPLDLAAVSAASSTVPILYLAATHDDCVGILAAGERTLRSLDLPHLGLDECVRRIRQLNAFGPESCALGVSKWLERALVRPLGWLLDGFGSLRVCPFGPLSMLPIQAALEKRLPTSIVPSASYVVGNALIPRRPLEEMRYVGVSGPTRAEGGLSWAGDELRRAQKCFHDGRSQIFELDTVVTEEMMQAASRAQVVHFACHGRSNLTRPLASSMQISRSQRATATDFLVEPMAKAELVILSACTTLGSSWAASENSLGLAGIIAQSTGAAVLHTIWPVDDEVASDLVSTFVERFLNTRDAAAALAESKLRIQNSYGSDPAVAEGFTVFG